MADSDPPQPVTYIVASWTTLEVPTSQPIEDEISPHGREWLSAMQSVKKDSQPGFLRAVFGRVIEAPETVWLVTAWQTQDALDAFEKSDDWAEQREKLSKFSSTALVTQHCHVDGQFWDALSDNTAITDVYFPVSLSAQAKEQAESVRGLVYFMAPGRGKPMAYSRRGSRGWVQGTVEYEGQDSIVLRFWDYWKSRESEEQFKGSAGIIIDGGRYTKLTEYLEEQLREAGMLGMRERHCKFVEVPFFFS